MNKKTNYKTAYILCLIIFFTGMIFFIGYYTGRLFGIFEGFSYGMEVCQLKLSEVIIGI